MSDFKNLTWMKFGRLTVIERAENCGHHTRWKCICECGKETIAHTTSLTSGRSQSCGCKNREDLLVALTKHGEANKTHLYKVWLNMHKRCNNKNYDHYNRYGGRGIKVCSAWNDYSAFKDWALSHGYNEKLEIDRINNDGDYEPSNCKWSTRKEQVMNRSNTVYMIDKDGSKKTLKELSEKYGVRYKLAYQRKTKGLPFDEIFKRKEIDGRKKRLYLTITKNNQ